MIVPDLVPASVMIEAAAKASGKFATNSDITRTIESCFCAARNPKSTPSGQPSTKTPNHMAQAVATPPFLSSSLADAYCTSAFARPAFMGLDILTAIRTCTEAFFQRDFDLCLSG